MSVSGVMQCAIDYPHRYLGFIAWCVVSNRVGTHLLAGGAIQLPCRSIPLCIPLSWIFRSMPAHPDNTLGVGVLYTPSMICGGFHISIGIVITHSRHKFINITGKWKFLQCFLHWYFAMSKTIEKCILFRIFDWFENLCLMCFFEIFWPPFWSDTLAGDTLEGLTLECK